MAGQSILISIEVLSRLLDTLCDQGSMGRTKLSFLSRLNYLVCVKYIKLMEDLGWVQVTGDDRDQRVAITPTGREHREAILKHLEERLRH